MRPLAIRLGMLERLLPAFALGHALAGRGVLTDTSAPLAGSQRVASVREALSEPNELVRGEQLAPLPPTGPHLLPMFPRLDGLKFVERIVNFGICDASETSERPAC